MTPIPSKCPKCGKTKSWKEEVNAFKSGIPVGGFGRIRLCVFRGLLARPVKKAAGFYKVTYCCHSCGFRKEYDTKDAK